MSKCLQMSATSGPTLRIGSMGVVSIERLKTIMKRCLYLPAGLQSINVTIHNMQFVEQCRFRGTTGRHFNIPFQHKIRNVIAWFKLSFISSWAASGCRLCLVVGASRCAIKFLISRARRSIKFFSFSFTSSHIRQIIR